MPTGPVHQSAPPRGVGARVAGAVLVWIINYTLWAGTWTLLALAMSFEPLFVLSPFFIALGSLPAVSALLMNSPFAGGFLGGGLPLGVYALYGASQNEQFLRTATPLAWFVVFFFIGGMLGALTAAAAVTVARKLRIPLPRG
jgi:hypothetical protein